MRFSEDAIKGLITAIGYAPQDGKSGIYLKSYPEHDGYCIFVDFYNRQIIYDSGDDPSGVAIKVWERTTSNFSQDENLVVLECVDSLLEKGYAPSCIELEKTYPSGHGRSGRLDILVKSIDGAPFLMIECKTWGAEFDKEQSKMLKSGGQLFTYYANDRAAEFLCLYTSRINDSRERKNIIVDVDPAWASLSGVKEIYDHWNKNFKDNGIFDSYAEPYDVKHRALTYGKLETLKEEHSGKIYNQIMEILRHNAISDKPNAFNKLLNLFVCKIIDESDKNPEDELEFQWLENDTDESLQLRLNDLYKKGMWRFLEIKVIDYEQREVSEKLASIEDSITKQWIMKMYTDTRLKKSPNFAFVEVQDDRTFELNAKVVREIVELLQAYKFRYEQKHEFLGNFFELLLNTSMKQEAGQFFTPVPITRFIISSLPLTELVQKRVDDRQDEPLPTVIDYACGSGHFLTEYMAQMQEIIDKKIDITHTSPRIKNLIQSWQGFTKFLWAKDCVYGIDLDNRLVKTTKVSAFFNGDGEANIVWANGLDSFTKSEAFRGKLVGAGGQDNGKFDILISNPPYSVDAFRSTIKYGEESFELYPSLTDNSSEIECLFVERMKQLLKVGGWAAVILPSSILTNGGIHARAREILLKYFRFKAIVELGPNTFMKTGTNTVVLFLERRGNDDHLNISRTVDRFFTAYNDVAVSGIENAFSSYVSNVYDRLTFEDYVSLFSGTPSEAAKAHELYEDYIKAFGEDFRSKAIEVEKEKLLYFLLTCNQTIVLVKTGKGKEEKKFLGYEFSERRGHEGLHWLTGGTMLYDESDPLNPKKAGSYIYRAFLGEDVDIDESISHNISRGRLSGFIEYGTSKSNKSVNLGKQPKSMQQSQHPFASLGNVCTIISGQSPEGQYYNDEGVGTPFYQGKIEFTQKYLGAPKKWTTSVTKLAEKDDVVMSVRAPAGPVNMVQNQICIGRGLAALRCGTEILPAYLFYVLRMMETSIAGRNGMAFSSISQEEIAKIKIPLPPLDIQQKIVAEIEQTEGKEQAISAQIELQHVAIEHIFKRIEESYGQFSGKTEMVQIGSVAEVQGGKRLAPGENFSATETDFPYIRVSDFRDHSVDTANLQYITTAQHEKIKRYVIRSSDVYLSIAGTLGLAGIVPDALDGANLTENAAKLAPDGDRVDQRFLMYMLCSSFLQKQIQSAAVGSGTPKLSLKCIKKLQIPLPSLDEQRQIAAEIQQAEEQITQLNTRLGTLKAEKDSILKKYL